MKDNNNKGRLIFKDGKLVMNNTEKPVFQISTEMIVLRKPIYKN